MENIKVEVHGEVLATIGFLHGLAAEKLRRERLDYQNLDYEILAARGHGAPDNATRMSRRPRSRLLSYLRIYLFPNVGLT